MKKHNTEHGLPIIHARAAGIDIGSRFHVVAVPTALAEEPVQTFQAFTADLERIVLQCMNRALSIATSTDR